MRRSCACLILVWALICTVCLAVTAKLCQAQSTIPETNDRLKFSYFKRSFERANGQGHDQQLEQTFSAIKTSVDRLRQLTPGVTLGGMLSLVIYESGARLAFFNTLDSQNYFKRKLNRRRPFSEQPPALYSYQFGIVPVHTSLFRPCIPGTQEMRRRFDTLAREAGFNLSDREIGSIATEFEVVCRTVRGRKAPDAPGAVDYYILNAHGLFGVPPNKVGRDLAHLATFPFYSARVTTSLFFSEIESRK